MTSEMPVYYRAMTASEWSEEVSQLAPHSLQFLACGHYYAQDLSNISRLSGLTRLEILAPKDSRDFRAIRRLGLIDLVLINSCSVRPSIFVHGALTKLQTLHIEHGYDRSKLQPSSLKQQQRLNRISENIFSLPNLHQVSGFCILFTWAQNHQLQHWEMLTRQHYTLSHGLQLCRAS